MRVCFAGDGDFQMNCQELGAALQADARPIVLIVNNGSYGTIRMHQERHFPRRVSGTEMINPDFAALARAYGFHAERIERTEEFADAFARALASPTGAVLDLNVASEAITPGMTITDLQASFRELERESQPGALINRAARIQFGRHIGATNQMRLWQIRRQAALRFLSGTKNDAVHLQQVRCSSLGDMQPGIIDLFIGHPSHHLHPAFGQICAVNPSGCFAQAGANFLGFALQQKDLTGGRRDLWHHAFYAAAGLESSYQCPIPS